MVLALCLLLVGNLIFPFVHLLIIDKPGQISCSVLIGLLGWPLILLIKPSSWSGLDPRGATYNTHTHTHPHTTQPHSHTIPHTHTHHNATAPPHLTHTHTHTHT